MEIIDLKQLLVDGAVLSIPIGALIAITFRWKPRIWLRDLPEDIQELADPMTEAEKRWAWIVGLLFIGWLLFGIVVSTLRFGFDHSFLSALLHAYLIFQMFNLFDLVVIDLGVVILINPTNPPIAGTENAHGYKDFGFHALQSLKGVVIGVPFAVLATGVAWIVETLI